MMTVKECLEQLAANNPNEWKHEWGETPRQAAVRILSQLLPDEPVNVLRYKCLPASPLDEMAISPYLLNFWIVVGDVLVPKSLVKEIRSVKGVDFYLDMRTSPHVTILSVPVEEAEVIKTLHGLGCQPL